MKNYYASHDVVCVYYYYVDGVVVVVVLILLGVDLVTRLELFGSCC
jgi:hypothetical protein